MLKGCEAFAEIQFSSSNILNIKGSEDPITLSSPHPLPPPLASVYTVACSTFLGSYAFWIYDDNVMFWWDEIEYFNKESVRDDNEGVEGKCSPCEKRFLVCVESKLTNSIRATDLQIPSNNPFGL